MIQSVEFNLLDRLEGGGYKKNRRISINMPDILGFEEWERCEDYTLIHLKHPLNYPHNESSAKSVVVAQRYTTVRQRLAKQFGDFMSSGRSEQTETVPTDGNGEVE